MSNVATFASPYPSYSEPNFITIAQSTKDISRLAVFRSAKLTAVMDKAQRASGYALDLNNVVGEELVAISAKVQNLDFGDLFGQLAEIDRELAKPGLSTQEIQEIQTARNEVAGVFASGIRDTKARLRQAAGRISQKAAEVSGVVLAERTRETLTEHQNRQPKIIQAIAAKRAEWQKLDDDRSKIIAAQDVIRARNIADIAKDFIPKDLEKLDLKKPEVEAIRLGVEVLKKLLSEVSEGFKYSDLADQRKGFDGKIAQLDGDIHELLEDQKQNNALIDDLTAVITIDDKRNTVVSEVSKLPTAFTGFADELDKLSGTSVTHANVDRLVGAIRSYTGDAIEARNEVIIV